MTCEEPSPNVIDAVLIAGPTASGKSALALELAKEFNGVIVNADSMQVYAELRIVTNRPSDEEEAAIPHRLYGFRPSREPYSAALWLRDVASILAEAQKLGRLPIIVGGTGLYFKGLTEGLSAIPDIPAHIRMHYRMAARSETPQALHAELARRDPVTASLLRPTDPQRVVRALEVFEATGRPLAEWQTERERPLIPLSRAFPIVVTTDRAELYRRCDLRFDAMIAAGAVSEAEQFASLHLDQALPVMRAVGLRPLIACAQGKMPLKEASRISKTNTRNYAKRQCTWINSNFSNWKQHSTQYKERTKSDLHLLLRSCLTQGN
jgi:tRNA dimethylallyltransferase